jgi:uncharacterized phiE125 gp8 family phage protein
MLVLVAPPLGFVVSLDEAKAHLRVEGTDEDDAITALLGAAIGSLDGPDGTLGRALSPQTLELRLAGFGEGPVRLPLPPCLSVTSVKVTGSDGAEATVDPAVYRLVPGGSAFTACVELAYGRSWPAVRSGADAVRIRYQAGYGAGELPPPIRTAILMRVAHLYENRGGNNQGGEPPAIEALLGPFRVAA